MVDYGHISSCMTGAGQNCFEMLMFPIFFDQGLSIKLSSSRKPEGAPSHRSTPASPPAPLGMAGSCMKVSVPLLDYALAGQHRLSRALVPGGSPCLAQGLERSTCTCSKHKPSGWKLEGCSPLLMEKLFLMGTLPWPQLQLEVELERGLGNLISAP